jgi:hypothetical protein
MNKILLMIIIFLLGFTIRDISDFFIPSAKAEVAGMDFSALETDTDFRIAVESTIEDCHADSDNDLKIKC